MEHIGRHFEDAKKDDTRNDPSLDVESWATDVDVEKWMIAEGILKESREDGIVIDGDH